jgi:histidinol dehydrogenase
MAANLVPTLDSTRSDFAEQLRQRLAWDDATDAEVAATVREILAAVRTGGDEALLDYTRKLDRWQPASIADIEVTQEELLTARERVDEASVAALESAAARITAYHRHQKAESWQYSEADGTVLGQKITPLDKVGIYVPGGKAAYPSSVLMNALPAKVAGVEQIVMTVPTPAGVRNDMVLAAASIAGVDRVMTIGGAQAVAALAFGTETVPRVDKIVGPGNIFVATAKQQVFGQVGLDMIAGPSEILVVCDGGTDPDWIAMDLFSQAEHDENAQSILMSPDRDFLARVHDSIRRLLPTMERADIIERSLSARGLFIAIPELDAAVDIINTIAPEHLELSVEDPDALLPGIRHAGAIFMGRYTAEAIGDYCAGPNHVLPTAGTARFSSPLGVYDFQKRSSVIHCSADGARSLGALASTLARGESLTAHARSAEYRLQDKG